ncbi:hypothetical protein C8A01DRAFT_33334 [Parachaetomium inaequale]|uniref:Uncharacterized protein n=1 Tax=Parachaetomium inaequale TaxID=2588326 RepID=A0AAN6SUF4_9PEZI|nr:hypothetical protein C8A01DRAFT_33334 [Parachaetomium inaequale]
MKTPSRQSTQSDSSSIVIVEYGTHTPDRSPQYNQTNMSSSEVGDASANGGSSSSIVLSERGADMDIDTVPGYQLDHKPPSNISTETPGTDETATVTDHLNHPFFNNPLAPPTTLTPSAPAPAAAAYPQLTLRNMEAHQRELEQFHAGGVSGWVDGAGMGLSRRLAAYQASVACSLLTTAGGHAHSMGDGSGESSFGGGAGGGGEWMVVVPPMMADEEVAAAGAWCCEEGFGWER